MQKYIEEENIYKPGTFEFKCITCKADCKNV